MGGLTTAGQIPPLRKISQSKLHRPCQMFGTFSLYGMHASYTYCAGFHKRRRQEKIRKGISALVTEKHHTSKTIREHSRSSSI